MTDCFLYKPLSSGKITDFILGFLLDFSPRIIDLPRIGLYNISSCGLEVVLPAPLGPISPIDLPFFHGKRNV
jgi:hypothetical protein